MSSSTSNSREIYGKICLKLGLAMLGMMIAYWAFLLSMGHQGLMGRVTQAREALPEIVAQPEPQVMVFGSSMVHAGFSPRQFDSEVKAKGKDVKSYNFGFGGLNPFFQDYLSRRIREEYQANDKKLKLAVIEFNPFQTTKTRWNGAISIVDSFITMLASDKELLEIAKTDITRGLRLYNIKYLRGNISAEMATTFFGRGVFPAKRPKREKDDEEIDKKRDELDEKLDEYFKQDFPEWHGKRWYLPWAGGGTIPADRTPEAVTLYGEFIALRHTKANMTNYVNRRIATADIIDMNFEPLLVDSFINIVENFKQFSEKVEVVMLPRNTDWVNYPPEARARLDATIAQIEKATGLKTVDHQDLPVINPGMFRDATHLAAYVGNVPYTHYLVEQYFDDL